MTISVSVAFPPEEPTHAPLGMRRVRKWGDPIMVQNGFDVNQIGSSNFQAVKAWNDGNRTWGGVTNFLRIPHDEVLLLRDLQFPETTQAGHFDEDAKMEWLCSYRGSIYMYERENDAWEDTPIIRWGTIALGGNLVQVERYEWLRLSLGSEAPRYYEMARLVGFTPADWERPMEDLLAEGLVHRCYCAYRDNGFGDTPKGVVYSPFFSPLHYDFAGAEQPTALYLPTLWLEPTS